MWKPWRADAACKGTHDLRAHTKHRQKTQAFIDRYCRVCPVVNACGEAGEHEELGVWGGQAKHFTRRGTVRRDLGVGW